MKMKKYTGAKRNEISFPLGGIGSGCIGLGGDSRLAEWEIMNRPTKGRLNGFSHFAVRPSCQLPPLGTNDDWELN